MKYVFFFWLMMLFSSCSQTAWVALQDIQNGLFTERAHKTNVQTFFNRRMDSKIVSDPSTDWVIVHEDSNYVYYGKLNNQELDVNAITVDPFYKTDKIELTRLFPIYKNTHGKHIKAKIYKQVIEPYIENSAYSNCAGGFNVDFVKRDYKLTPDGIVAKIKFKGKCYESTLFTEKMTLLLDSKNLNLIEIQ